ncbi:unnamed protein product [Victoria cruziana]
MMNYNGRTGGDDVFLEYDPTPYGGGYDQVLAYGEPLSSSHETCYPPESKADPSLNRENFTYGHGSCEDSRYQEEEPNFIANSNGGDVDRPRYPLDSEPWKGDPSHPYGYGYGYGYDCGDNWSSGWDWFKRAEEEQYASGGHLDYIHPVAYVDSLTGWLHLDQEDSPYQSYLGEDNRGRQDTRNGCMNEWKSAVEYIFGSNDSFEQNHTDGAMANYSFCDYQSYDRVTTANNHRLEGRSFSR